VLVEQDLVAVGVDDREAGRTRGRLVGRGHRFEIDIAGPVELEMRALDWLFTTWLPRSEYVPDHQPMFEAWNGEPFAHGHEHFEVRVQIAVTDAATPL
jgi:hypothetical protein